MQLNKQVLSQYSILLTHKLRLLILGSFGLLLAGLVAAYIYWYAAGNSTDKRESELLLKQGIALFEQMKYTETLQELDKIPDNAMDWRILYYQGSAHLMLRNYEMAIDLLERALELNHRESRLLYALGVVYYKQEKIKIARGYFASALEVNPDDENAKSLLNTMAKLERLPPGSYKAPIHGSSRGLSKAPAQTGSQEVDVKSSAPAGDTDTPAGDLTPTPDRIRQ